MLPAPQSELCLGCHSTQAAADNEAARGLLSPTSEPQLLSLVLSQPFVHPIDDHAFSRWEPSVVTCTSCHSPHRRSTREVTLDEPSSGGRRISTRDPSSFESELCSSCHGSAGVETQSPLDLSRLTNPNNRSFHPIEAPGIERSPSVLPELREREINCTDCHGNSDPDGARGPHGSAIQYILVREYVTLDGGAEGPETYGLCYGCHDREAVLESGPFPLHRLHAIEERVSCATCHSAHGSVDNRALIRFGEETIITNVAPSGSTGRLEFASSGPGSGTCFVSCHGIDHAPATYGSADFTATRFSDSVGQPGAPAPGTDEIGLPNRPVRPLKPRKPPPPRP
jgi:hypothetical protein